VSALTTTARLPLVPDYLQARLTPLPHRTDFSRSVPQPIKIEPGTRIYSGADSKVKPIGFGEGAGIIRAAEARSAALLKAAEKRMGPGFGPLQPPVFDNWQQRQGISSYQTASRLR
jgi:hypothetical protein